MSLIPALETELRLAAQRTQPEVLPNAGMAAGMLRRPRRSWRGAPLLAIAAASLALAGGAYASRGFWLPKLGDTSYGHGVATAKALPADELATFGVLRREQTDADRNAAVKAVMRATDFGEVQTSEVRNLGTLPDGQVAVLVPARVPHGFDPTLPDMPRDQLFLAFYDPVTREVVGPTVPGDTLAVRAGDTMISLSKRLTPAQKALEERFLEREAAAGRVRRLAGPPVRYGVMSVEESRRGLAAIGVKLSEPVDYVGLVPDGVASVEVDGHPPVPVHGNFFMGKSTEAGRTDVTWFDKRGKIVPFASTVGTSG